MIKNLTIFFQAVVVVLGVAALVFLLWEPHLEGRNVNTTLFEIYFKDPFLAYIYLASVAFFAALYQAFKALALTRNGKTLSQAMAKSLRTIQYCAITLITFLLGAEAYLFIVQRGKEDDIAGGVAIGVLLILASTITAFVAARLGKVVKQKIPTSL